MRALPQTRPWGLPLLAIVGQSGSDGRFGFQDTTAKGSLERDPRCPAVGSSGKLQRICMSRVIADRLAPADEPATGELEELVADAFAAVLLRDRPGRHADFFLLGGDSLSSLRLIHVLQRQLALNLSPTVLFDHPSVAELAGRLDQLLDEAQTQLEPPRC